LPTSLMFFWIIIPYDGILFLKKENKVLLKWDRKKVKGSRNI